MYYIIAFRLANFYVQNPLRATKVHGEFAYSFCNQHNSLEVVFSRQPQGFVPVSNAYGTFLTTAQSVL